MQVMNKEFGGTALLVVKKEPREEDRVHAVELDKKSNLFKGLANRQEVMLTHGDSICKVADNFKVVGTSDNLVTDIANEKIRLYGLQFHPRGVCGLVGTFCLQDRLGLAIRVLCGNGEINMERDLSETQVLFRLVVNYAEMVTKEHALLNRIENDTTEEERVVLAGKSKKQYTATLLPIKTVGIQCDSHSYSYNYAVCISTVFDPDWEDILYLVQAKGPIISMELFLLSPSITLLALINTRIAQQGYYYFCFLLC